MDVIEPNTRPASETRTDRNDGVLSAHTSPVADHSRLLPDEWDTESNIVRGED